MRLPPPSRPIRATRVLRPHDRPQLAEGHVRYLSSINDFAGIYTGLTIGATAVNGKGAATFQNDKGVVLSVKAKTDGAALSLGASGFDVSLAK